MKKHLILGILFIAMILLARTSGIIKYINVKTIKENRLYLHNQVKEHYVQSVMLFILIYAIVVSFSLPLAAVCTVLGGFLFGIFLGAIYSNIGATIGATISFLIVRHSFGSLFQERYRKRVKQFNEAIDAHGANYLLAVHFLAFIPFFVVNILAALTKISLRTFIWTTSVGIFPGALVYTAAGQQLAKIDSIRDVFSLKIIFVFFLLSCLVLIPVAIQRRS